MQVPNDLIMRILLITTSPVHAYLKICYAEKLKNADIYNF